ncbi:MAG: nuclear transport factor 2 family protein [Actinomycetes bacterium]
MDEARTDVEAVQAAVQEYVQACARADPDALRGALHPAWTMYGIDSLAVDVGTGVEDFVEWVGQQRPPDGYRASIAQVDIAGDAAVATLREENYYGVDYTIFFTLVRYDGVWQITTKTHSQIPPVAPRT